MKDILVDEQYDIQVSGGDFATGECLKQSQMLLLRTNKGEWKQHPVMGVGTTNYLESIDNGALAREIRSQFSLDGMKVENIKVDGTILNVEAEWKK